MGLAVRHKDQGSEERSCPSRILRHSRHATRFAQSLSFHDNLKHLPLLELLLSYSKLIRIIDPLYPPQIFIDSYI